MLHLMEPYNTPPSAGSRGSAQPQCPGGAGDGKALGCHWDRASVLRGGTQHYE